MESVILSAEYCHTPASFGPHYHSCHEILYVTGGWAEVGINGKIYQISPGNLAIFSRYEQHSVRSASQDYRRYVLKIAPSRACYGRESYRLFSVLFNRPDRFHNVLKISDQEMIRIFQRIIEERSSRKAMNGDMQNLLMQELLVYVFRQYADLLEPVTPDSLDAVRQIQEQFEREPGEEYSLEKLAQEYHLSSSYLSHQFRKITGQPVMGYLIGCRMAAAKNELCRTRFSIGQIAEHCGFADTSNFSRMFRKMTGSSPTEFRRKYDRETPETDLVRKEELYDL